MPGKTYRGLPAIMISLFLTALLSACGVDNQPKPSAERAEAVNQSLRTALQLPSISPGKVAVLLFHKDYSALEGLYQEVFDNYQKDVNYEAPFFTSYNIFVPGSIISQTDLDSWVETSGSAIAYAARGCYRAGQASQARGTNWTRSTPTAKLRQMREYCEAAASDLQRAVELNPTLTPAWISLIRLSMMTDLSFSPDQVFATAVSHDPRSFYLRQQYMLSLQPRWGGSADAMLAFAAFCARDVENNPRFWVLQGDVYADIASMLSLDGDDAGAIEWYDKALLFGDKLSTLQYRAYSLLKCGKDAEAEKTLRTILSYDPSHRAAMTMMNQLSQKHS